MSSAVVVGAGVFGASTARELDRRGWDVTLVEQYTPGNVRSGSGGDTRLLRFSHGDQDWYTLSARRSLELWRELERETGERLFEPEFVHSVTRELVAGCAIPMLVMPGNDVAHPAAISDELVRLAPRAEVLKYWKGEGRSSYAARCARDFLLRNTPR